MKDKKSFLLYCDLLHTVDRLPDDTAGQLFKTILRYVNDLSPDPNDLVLQVAFEPIRQSLKRDLLRYQNIVERNRVNGLKGGRPKGKSEKPQAHIPENLHKQIEAIYNLYPATCGVSKRSTGKNAKDKIKIEKLIKSRGFESISSSIKGYLSVNELGNEGKTFKIGLKNFGTLLNNLPDAADLRKEYADIKADSDKNPDSILDQKKKDSLTNR